MPALSPPNFLAYNPASLFSTGGVPVLPEFVIPLPAANGFSAQVSGGSTSDVLFFIALGAGGLKDFAVVTAPAGSYAAVNLSGTGITFVIIAGNTDPFVLDNVQTF